MSIDINEFSIVDILDANIMFNFGIGNFYKTISIPEKNFENISKNSIIEFDSFLHPLKKDFDKSKVDIFSNYLPHLHPEIEKKKENLLKLLDDLYINNDTMDNSFIEIDYFGITFYSEFINKHFDLILDAIKSHFSLIFARNKLDFIKKHKIKLNFLSLYLLSHQFFIPNDEEKEFNNNGKNAKCINDNYIFIFKQYLMLHENFIYRQENEVLRRLKNDLDNLYPDRNLQNKPNSEKLSFTEKITPAVLFKLKELSSDMGYHQALEKTASFFSYLPKSVYQRPGFSAETLKKWIEKKKKYLENYKSDDPSVFIKTITHDEIISWFQNLAMKDERFLSLLHITSVPLEKSDNEVIERKNQEIRKLISNRKKLLYICDASNKLMTFSFRINWEVAHKLYLKHFPSKHDYGRKKIRVILGFNYLKAKNKLNYKIAKKRWLENPYWQFFCGEEFFNAHFPDIFNICEEEMHLDEQIIISIIENSKPENYYKYQK